jgi:hypothetical protein
VLQFTALFARFASLVLFLFLVAGRNADEAAFEKCAICREDRFVAEFAI